MQFTPKKLVWNYDIIDPSTGQIKNDAIKGLKKIIEASKEQGIQLAIIFKGDLFDIWGKANPSVAGSFSFYEKMEATDHAKAMIVLFDFMRSEPNVTFAFKTGYRYIDSKITAMPGARFFTALYLVQYNNQHPDSKLTFRQLCPNVYIGCHVHGANKQMALQCATQGFTFDTPGLHPSGKGIIIQPEPFLPKPFLIFIGEFNLKGHALLNHLDEGWAIIDCSDVDTQSLQALKNMHKALTKSGCSVYKVGHWRREG